MCGIVLDEVVDEPVDLCRLELAALGREPASDHRARATANHVARRVIRDRRQTFAGKDLMLSVATRSGALSTSVPSRSKTTVGATILRDR